MNPKSWRRDTKVIYKRVIFLMKASTVAPQIAETLMNQPNTAVPGTTTSDRMLNNYPLNKLRMGKFKRQDLGHHKIKPCIQKHYKHSIPRATSIFFPATKVNRSTRLMMPRNSSREDNTMSVSSSTKKVSFTSTRPRKLLIPSFLYSTTSVNSR